MSHYGESSTVADYRIRSFADSENETILTGERRTGRVPLMDSIVNFLIRERPDSNLVLIEVVPKDLSKFFEKELKGKDIVLIYSVLDVPEWETVLQSVIKEKVTVYCGQDLCHQVPACFKRIILPNL